MTERKTDHQGKALSLAYDIDEPPHKVWHAITDSDLRQHWLPAKDLADAQAAAMTPGEAVSYRMRETTPPYLESFVTFRLAANDDGGTSLRIIHELADARIDRTITAAANTNGAPVMLAA